MLQAQMPPLTLESRMRQVPLIVACAVLAPGCGDDSVSATLLVGQLSGQENPAGALTLASELPPGSGSFGFAFTEGMRLSLTQLNFAGADSNASVDLDGEVLELGADEVAVSIDRPL
ncbi:MAG: hypothetical protein AAF658_09670, partial [Myxococcota bacterium]